MQETKKSDRMPAALLGTRTAANLEAAFGAECRAAMLYAWYGRLSRREGYEEIARIFEETSANEREHAEIWYRELGGHGNVADMLMSAASGEHYEWMSMYRDYAEVARNEGFAPIAALFERIAEVEERHEKRYNHYHTKLTEGKMLRTEEEGTRWVCLNCGYVAVGREPPRICPACAHAQGYFREESTEEARILENTPTLP